MMPYVEEPLKIESCRADEGCPRSLIKGDNLKNLFENTAEKSGFIKWRREQLKGKIKPHQVFRVCIAGCPNSCSQPQIKDFGVVGKVYPGFKADLCNSCAACLRACRENAVSLEEKKVMIDEKKCIGCADCIGACPTGALYQKKRVWKIIAGGKLGRHPRLAETVAETSNKAEAARYLNEALKTLMNIPDFHVRLGDVMDRYLEILNRFRTGNGEG